MEGLQEVHAGNICRKFEYFWWETRPRAAVRTKIDLKGANLGQNSDKNGPRRPFFGSDMDRHDSRNFDQGSIPITGGPITPELSVRELTIYSRYIRAAKMNWRKVMEQSYQ